METPSSTRRVTRSQTAASSNKNNPISRKWEDADEAASKLRQTSGNGKQQQEARSALVDITNDSPIVGLAAGTLRTPSSSFAKKRGGGRVKRTPGSGEALLRSQVKTLLQKVEEEAEILKVSVESKAPFFHLEGLVGNSPTVLLAPTPANTPQVSDGISESHSALSEEQLISKVLSDIFEGKEEEESAESQINLVSRSLLSDFSEKSEVTHDPFECSSDLTFQGGYSGSECKVKSAITDDDNASIWSIQVNASTRDEEEEEEDGVEDEEEERRDIGSFVDELCEGMNNMFVSEKKMEAKFEGKHTRFVYNSDDEMVAEERASEGEVSPAVVRLKGVATPRGKHIRFPEEADES